jgi:hypothetical protein
MLLSAASLSGSKIFLSTHAHRPAATSDAITETGPAPPAVGMENAE